MDQKPVFVCYFWTGNGEILSAHTKEKPGCRILYHLKFTNYGEWKTHIEWSNQTFHCSGKRRASNTLWNVRWSWKYVVYNILHFCSSWKHFFAIFQSKVRFWKLEVWRNCCAQLISPWLFILKQSLIASWFETHCLKPLSHLLLSLVRDHLLGN